MNVTAKLIKIYILYPFILIFSINLNSILADTNNINAANNLDWIGNLSPLSESDWDINIAKHLLERAGFGGTPGEIKKIYELGLIGAVNHLVNYESINDDFLKEFDESDIHDPGLVDFPPSRPATTKLARETGEALGIKVKTSGNRKMQPIVNKFFFWLRASMLETRRLAYWWAERMLISPRPLEEKMTLFWHNHFANSEAKVRDYRKLKLQNATFRKHATGNFRELLIATAQDPAMLYFLDAGQNIKGAPNENFAREIMELFTLGDGNYTEKDIREAARAFTGWNTDDLVFLIDDDKHDSEDKTVLSNIGNFDGVDVINILLTQEASAKFLVKKIYKEFVSEYYDEKTINSLAHILRENDYELKPLLKTMFLSKDFYSSNAMGTHIKSPVVLIVNTYKKLGLDEIPGIPDFNEASTLMGQTLFWPPTVAGWAGGKSWITPGLLMERGNFARSFLYPDIDFIPHDIHSYDPKIITMHEFIRRGEDITTATQASNGDKNMVTMSEGSMMADRDEDFNTRYGSYRGWQMAIEKVKPIKRVAAKLNISRMVLSNGAKTSEDAVNYLLNRFLSVPVSDKKRLQLINFLDFVLGTDDIIESESYLEDPLRLVLHLIMSEPEYQLG